MASNVLAQCVGSYELCGSDGDQSNAPLRAASNHFHFLYASESAKSFPQCVAWFYPKVFQLNMHGLSATWTCQVKFGYLFTAFHLSEFFTANEIFIFNIPLQRLEAGESINIEIPLHILFDGVEGNNGSLLLLSKLVPRHLFYV